jgi:hypothetical protein
MEKYAIQAIFGEKKKKRGKKDYHSGVSGRTGFRAPENGFFRLCESQ